MDLHRLNLGPSCLLGSHCIVLVQHYLDQMVHCCPSKLWEGPSHELTKITKQRQRRKKRRGKDRNRSVDVAAEAAAAAAVCSGCGAGFSSRNQLFKHLRADNECGIAG